jgi:hypothetical protein
MAKQASPEAVKQFLRDLGKLKRNGFTFTRIGQLARITNISAYRNGTKTPGEVTLGKFYGYFAGILKDLLDDPDPTQAYGSDQEKNEDKASGTEDRQGTYAQPRPPGQSKGDYTEDYIEMLKRTNERLWANNEHAWTEFHEIAASNRSLANSQDTLAKSNLILAENNKTMIDRFGGPPPNSTTE